MPDPAQNCIHNIFGNLGDVWSGINSMLQGRGVDFINTMGRVMLNTTPWAWAAASTSPRPPAPTRSPTTSA